jgi:hypothetical protein
MRTFVQECRREWKRLGVPDAIADEMATDLAADLADAEADGVTPEELLGGGASDPRSFAATWAAERGVAHGLQAGVRGRLPSPRMVGATAAFVIVAIVGAVLAIVGAPTDRTASFGVPSPSGDVAVWVGSPDVNATDRIMLRVPSPVVGLNGSRGELRQAGWLVLVAGIGGTVLSTLFWSYSAGLAGRSGRRVGF